MRDPAVVTAEMQTAVTLANGKPLVYQEFGFPTHPDLNGSEAKQSQFFQLGLEEWKRQGAVRIPFLSAFKRRDYLGTSCGVAGTNAYKFLCSLGMVNSDRSAKAIWSALPTALLEIGLP